MGLPVDTNGIGQRTTAHLNLTVTMAAQVEKERRQKDKFCANRRPPVPEPPRVRIAGRPNFAARQKTENSFE